MSSAPNIPREPSRPPFLAGYRAFLLLLAVAAGFVLYVLLPSYGSPSSRVYASRLGYPAVMRLLGRPIEVRAEPVQVRPMVRTIAAEGVTTYLNEIRINSEVPGIVTEIGVEAGDEIEPGKVLLAVSPGGHETRLSEHQRHLRDWELKHAKIQRARQEELLKRNLTSKIQFEEAEVNLRRAEAASKLAVEEHAHSLRSRSMSVTGEPLALAAAAGSEQKVEIQATAKGTVLRRRVQLGENLIDLRNPLLLIGDRLVFRANVDQRYAGLVRMGDRGRFYLRAHPEMAFPAEVVRVAHEVQSAVQVPSKNPGTRPFTFSVWMSIPANVLADRSVLPGMNGYAVFERPYSAPAVPESALLRYSGRTGTVLAVDNANRLALKTVTYTGAENGWVALEASDLKEGSLVVLNGQTALKQGDAVLVQAQAPASEIQGLAQRSAAAPPGPGDPLR